MTIAYKNSKVYFTDSKNGIPVVFLHGFLENSSMWHTLIEALPSTYRFVCIDLPGHGKTDNFGYIHTMEDMAEMVYFVLKHLKIESAFMIGHSMGGYVALALAETHPEVFRGLCLMNSTFEADNKERKLLRTRANKMAQTNFENLVKMSFANLFAPESKLKHKTEYEKALSEALKTSPQGYIAAQEGMKLRPNRLKALEALKAKKLIIYGLKDPVINGESMRENLSETDVKYEEVSEGHMSHIENKSELSYIINHFIE
ncbi:alpha/beta fold hydrolase [Winogradskyella sp. A3E31]|uniref:alpha/beta fold hydrolase n=1 Tax=Winogradskyella sp. A3E31 TaxID=3349637 RepID=UPI00398B1911